VRSPSSLGELSVETAYLATVSQSDGAPIRLFVRAGRDDDIGNRAEVVVSEARLTELLAGQGLNVARVHGVNTQLGAAIYDWVDGAAEVEDTDPDTQQRRSTRRS
jgi:hypothetical protein